ncbi:MAG: hypothetical protein ACRDZ9_04605 [Acidimicrobiales bacterium]
MADRPGPTRARPYAPTALPSVTARALAVLAILVGGACGGLIGWAVADVQCGATGAPTATEGAGCSTVEGLGAFVGAVAGAAGVAVIAVLVLRAMAEWRRQLPPEHR